MNSYLTSTVGIALAKLRIKKKMNQLLASFSRQNHYVAGSSLAQATGKYHRTNNSFRNMLILFYLLNAI